MRNERKMKWISLVVLGLLVAVFAVAGPRANPRKGKVFYKKYCRVCHDGSNGGSDLTPMSKTMDQWSRAFKPGGDVESHIGKVKEKTGTDLTAQDLLDIQAFLVQHAADSDQPATCGN